MERTLMGVVALLLLMLNALMVEKYDAVFSVLADDYAKRLSYLFHVSGFDPNSYAILTEWGMRYDVLRHPLLPYLMALPASVNGVVVSLFGINAALYISALMSWACGLVSALLLYRLLRRIVGAAAEDAALLTLLFFSFAYIQVTCFVPDHFGLSLCLILLSLYLIGRAAKAGRVLKAWQTVLLFVLTAGVTLTNGLKVLAAEWVLPVAFLPPCSGRSVDTDVGSRSGGGTHLRLPEAAGTATLLRGTPGGGVGKGTARPPALQARTVGHP